MGVPELYPYQEDAVDYIVQSKNVLLAYEMGLGKTAITIRAIEEMMGKGDIRHPVLIVGLSSIMYQWSMEIDKFTDGSVALVIDGSPEDRKRKFETLNTTFVDYVITSYDLLIRDKDLYASRVWGAVVLDEVSAIKNFRAKRSIVAKDLGRRSKIRIGLTGTPITNGKAEEIFSIMQFIDPQVLGRWVFFEARYIRRHPSGWVTRYVNMDELHEKLSRHVLRKRQMDDDVKGYLPEVLYMPPVAVGMSPKMKRLYSVVASDCVDALEEVLGSFSGKDISSNLGFFYGEGEVNPQDMAVLGEVMQTYQALRMMCDHPQILVDSANDYFNTDGEKGSAYCARLVLNGELEDLSFESPKLKYLVRYIQDLVIADPDVKIVVFSTYTRSFKYIVEAINKGLDDEGAVLEFHGGLSPKARSVVLDSFKTNKRTRVLLSSDAGGYGVDLPEASVLINYNQPWTSGAQLQRNSRIVRASSDHKQVRIETLLVGDSVEERFYRVLQYKNLVSQGIIDGELSEGHGTIENTVESLKQFLGG